MLEVNATDFKNNFGQYLQKVFKAPVVVCKTGRPTAVLISYDEYLKLTASQKQEQKNLNVDEKEEALNKIRQAFKEHNVGEGEEHLETGRAEQE